MARKSPAFSFYPDSFIGGTITMPPLQRAAYVDLLCLQWLHGCFNFASALLVCRGIPESDVVQVLESKFEESDGMFFNPRLEEERQKQAAKSESGRIGGKISQAKRKQTSSKTSSKVPSKTSSEIEHSDSDSDSINREREREQKPEFQFADSLEIPELLNTPDFVQAWRDWIGWNLATTGERLNSLTAQEHLRQCLKWGAEKAVENIRHTISNRTKPGGLWEKRETFESDKPRKSKFDALRTM